jgi:hypothetical protein
LWVVVGQCSICRQQAFEDIVQEFC